MPKPVIWKNKLVAKYGINFRYMGIEWVRMMVVMSIPIPRFENIEVKPINFARCAKTLDNDDKDERQILRHLRQQKSGVHRPFLLLSIYNNKRNIILIKFMNTCVRIYTQLCLN